MKSTGARSTGSECWEKPSSSFLRTAASVTATTTSIFRSRRYQGCALRATTIGLIGAAVSPNLTTGTYAQTGYYYALSWHDTSNPLAFTRHDGRANVVWLDGHVAAVGSPNHLYNGLYSKGILYNKFENDNRWTIDGTKWTAAKDN